MFLLLVCRVERTAAKLVPRSLPRSVASVAAPSAFVVPVIGRPVTGASNAVSSRRPFAPGTATATALLAASVAALGIAIAQANQIVLVNEFAPLAIAFVVATAAAPATPSVLRARSAMIDTVTSPASFAGAW